MSDSWLNIMKDHEVLRIVPPPNPAAHVPTNTPGGMPISLSVQLPSTDWQYDSITYRPLGESVRAFEIAPLIMIKGGHTYTQGQLLKIYLREAVRKLPKGNGVLSEEDLGVAVNLDDRHWRDKKYWAMNFLCRWLEEQLEYQKDTRDQNAYYWFLRLRFLCVVEIFETSDDPKKKLVLPEYRRSFRDWFNVCFYEDRPAVENAYFFDWAGLNRECEVKALVFKGNCSGSSLIRVDGRVSEESSKAEPCPLLQQALDKREIELLGLLKRRIEAVKRWWSSYELHKFFKIRECSTKQPDGNCTCQEPCLPKHQIRNRHLVVQRLLDRWFPHQYDWVSMYRLLGQYWPLGRVDKRWGIGSFLIAGFMLYGLLSRWPPWPWTLSWVGVGLLESLVLAAIVCSIFREKILARSRLMIPRLTAAIFVGYAPLLFSKDVWEAFQMMERQPISFLVFAGAMGSLIYLHLELAKSGISHVWLRAMFIWGVGLIEALVIGIIVSDVLGDSIGFKSEITNQSWVWKGFFGFLYWKVIFLAGALALLLGVILQMIWEDKPITEPI